MSFVWGSINHVLGDVVPKQTRTPNKNCCVDSNLATFGDRYRWKLLSLAISEMSVGFSVVVAPQGMKVLVLV